MDPLMHILLPVLFLLAIRMDPRMVLLYSPFTILPDFDAAFGLHRAAFHSFIVAVLLPVALLAYSKYKRPEWTLASTLILFYLASHIVLDLGGVAFLWPFTTDMFYFDPQVTFKIQGGIAFGFDLDYGVRPFEQMGTTYFVSEYGFASMFLGALLIVVFRKEAKAAILSGLRIVKGFLYRYQE
jgi:membrane-bound metal-dependent hydrolase YbcI (DUF457 family)